jgi:1-deoxyxylulose-5-phosphate synthase
MTSKVFHPVHEGDDGGLAPSRVRRVAHESRERLGVERIDTYLIHEPDLAVPLADTLSALEALVDEGVVGAIGLSNVDAAYISEAVALAPIAVVQNEYSLLVRDAERDVMPLCAENGIAFEAFSPLAGGWLTGKYERGASYPARSRMTLRPDPYAVFVRDEVFDGVERLAAYGDPATLALAWILANPLVGFLVVGPRRPAHLDPVWAALDLQVDREELTELFAWKR